jgi:hypothetical protein
VTAVDRLLGRVWAWRLVVALAIGVRFYFLVFPVSTLDPIDPAGLGRALLHGQIPYRDFPFEYPPGALLGFILPGLLPADSASTVIWLQAVAVELWVLAAFRDDSPALRRCLLLTTLQFPLLSGGIDAFVMASLVFATVLLSRSDPRGWWLAGAGASVKLVPGILWGVGARWGRTGLAALLLTVGIVLVPLALAQSSRTHVGYLLERGVQQESVAATVTWAGQKLRGEEPHIEFRYGAQELEGATGAGVTAAAVFGILVVAVAAALRMGDRNLDIWLSTFAVLLLVLCGSKVLSPQFMIFGAPLAAKLGGRWFITYIPIPVLTFAAFQDSSKGDAFMSVVAIRNALLVGLAGAAAWHVLRASRSVGSRRDLVLRGSSLHNT